jgi:lactate permease
LIIKIQKQLYTKFIIIQQDLTVFPQIYILTLVAVPTALYYNMKKEAVTAAWRTTCTQLAPAAIALIFAVAMVRILVQSGLNSSGMDGMIQTMSGFTSEVVGRGWPFVAPFVGMFGSFIAGSNTVSNIFFGGLQYSVADALGVSRVIILSLQAVGGAVGNMICVHNVVAACAVVGNLGQEGKIIRRNLLPALLYSALTGILGVLLIYVLSVAVF